MTPWLVWLLSQIPPPSPGEKPDAIPYYVWGAIIAPVLTFTGALLAWIKQRVDKLEKDQEADRLEQKAEAARTKSRLEDADKKHEICEENHRMACVELERTKTAVEVLKARDDTAKAVAADVLQGIRTLVNEVKNKP